MKQTFQEKWRNQATFLCRKNLKTPATCNGFKDATVGLNIEEFIQDYNIGLACAMSNLIVIDCDVDDSKGYNGLETLKEYEQKLGKLPKTLTQKTPRGGRHFIFSSKGIQNPKGKIEKDIDLKFNGYVLLSPSSINGKYYEIIDGIDNDGNFIIAELPTTWLDFLNKSTNKGLALVGKNAVKSYKPKTYKNLDINKLFKNCAFLDDCKNNAEDLSEPMWHSMITCLAQIENSDELIHHLSEPYQGYSFEETQRKIDNARKFGYPQSCAYLSANYADICKNCKSLKKESEV